MENRCVVCNGEFIEGSLVNGKCSICAVDYPNADNLMEAMVQTGKKQEVHLNLTEDRVRNVIYEILSDAGLSRKKCEKCGSLYFSKSPAQKVCQKCRDKETIKDTNL